MSFRYNNLPEEIRARHVKDKSNAAYILGWSERRVSGSMAASDSFTSHAMAQNAMPFCNSISAECLAMLLSCMWFAQVTCDVPCYSWETDPWHVDGL